jgi:hypothetical protein
VTKNLKKQSSSHEDRFTKTIFVLFRCKITENDGSRDLLSRLRMHIDERDEVAFTVQQQRRQKPRCVGGSWLFIVTYSVAPLPIYRKDLPRVTASRNQLGLSL